MNIIFLAHPDFLAHQSIPRYTQMLMEGMKERGHSVRLLAPKKILVQLPGPEAIKKWLGYIDQYFIFPYIIKGHVRKEPKGTIFVFTDNALGPWVPFASKRPHIVHCHDFLAQRSAVGQIPENKTRWTGKKYQQYIRNGYSKAVNFISVSKSTQADLHKFLPTAPRLSEVVYNGMNQAFEPLDIATSRAYIATQTGVDAHNGFILHVGGNQWYKNRKGVVDIYTKWRSQFSIRLPLLLLGAAPDKKLKKAVAENIFRDDIHFIVNPSNELLKKSYAAASVLLFPSLNEGFGWPVVEAMASGCPVITTAQPPMTEVGGNAAIYIDRKPFSKETMNDWLNNSAFQLQKVITNNITKQQQIISNGLINAKKFDRDIAIAKIEAIYKKVLESN